jgi:hypothetical protein
MRDAGLIRHLEITDEPTRHGCSEDNTRLDFKGNFHRVVEVTSGAAVLKNARRGK